MSAVAALILAAGRGSRFGAEPKLLARLDGEPLVRHVARAALASRARPVVAVLGHRADEVGAALAGLSVATVLNPRFAEGLSTSLQAGFAALPRAAGGAVIMLGDMPRVSGRTVDALIEAWLAAGQPAAAVPTWEGRRGNPILLSRNLEPMIAQLTGDVGARPLLKGRSDVLLIEVGEPAILADVDTPQALAALG